MINVLGGLPRSGSTLLCNILNQNPEFYASSTSPLSGTIGVLRQFWGSSQEVKALYAEDKNAGRRMLSVLQANVASYYEDKLDESVVFDKSRDWDISLFKKICPQGKVILLVRDLREVAASCERHYQKAPQLRAYQGVNLEDRIKAWFGESDDVNLPGPADHGVVGNPLKKIKDVLDRADDSVLFVRYEDFAANPLGGMKAIYEYLRRPYYEGHQFENVENVSTDPDHIWLGHFPHEGKGKVVLKEKTWPKYFSGTVARDLVEQFDWFFAAFYSAKT